jgi:hypothetical protein
LELGEQGVQPSYERVTARLEDAGLKGLAVQIDEHARQVRVTPELAAHTLEYFRKRRESGLSASSPLAGPHGGGTAEDGTDRDAKARLRAATELHRKRVSGSVSR